MIRYLIAAILSLLVTGASAQLPPVGGGGTPSNTFNVLGFGASTTNTAAANLTAFQKATTAACAYAVATSPSAGAIIYIPAGGYNVDVGGGTPFAINCTGVSIKGDGPDSTVLYPSGNGDLIAFSPPSGQRYGGFGGVYGLRTFRSDSPTSGRCIAEDHVTQFHVENVHVTGCFIGVENNASINTWFTDSVSDGTETQSGSKMYWIHRPTPQMTTTGSTASGTTLPVNNTTNVYFGQTVTGHANIPANDTIVSWTVNSITLASPITGTVGASVTLVGTDQPPTAIIEGSLIQSALSVPPFTYDYALFIQSGDGIFLSNSHISWSRLGSMIVQPQTCAIGSAYAGDQIDNILSTNNVYFDKSGGSAIDFEPCGGWTTTGTATNGGTAMTVDQTPPFDITNYSVLMTGVPAGTTVSSGGTTTSLVLSGNGNSLAGVDRTVTFYPAYTGLNASHSMSGFIQGSVGSGVLLNDPALSTINMPGLMVTNSTKHGIDIEAGANIGLRTVAIRNSNFGNAGYNDIQIAGNARGIIIDAPIFVAGSFAVGKNINVTGQAQPPLISGNFNGSYVNTSLTTSGVFYAAAEPATSIRYGIYNSYGVLQGAFIGFNTGSTPAYPAFQAGGGTLAHVGGNGAAATLDVDANLEGAAGTVNIGGFHGDTVVVPNATVGASAATVSAGELAGAKISATGQAPGAGFAKMEWVAGTNVGTCKLIAYAGTSTTPATIVDNVGGGC